VTGEIVIKERNKKGRQAEKRRQGQMEYWIAKERDRKGIKIKPDGSG
jgi:preprotein translocase subunit Sec61beta